MSFSFKHRRSSVPWFGLGLVSLFLGSALLRFWGLERFNTLVFDEVYYANFARGFLQGVQEFGGHPPLSTYLIAGGIWLGEHVPWGSGSPENSMTGMMLSTVSYRWFNALTGSLIPLVVAAIALQLTHRRSYALIAGGFSALDGLFLVESRYALNNVYLVIFGLLGQWFFLMGLNAIAVREAETQEAELPWLKRWQVPLCLILSGVAFACSVAIKWNGLWFLLGAYGLWIAGWIVRRLNRWRPGILAVTQGRSPHPLEQLPQLTWRHMAFYLAWLPFTTYWLLWVPYMRLNPEHGFWYWQARILDYHNRVGGMDAHPYCSPWYSWFFMWRPVGYFYRTSHSWTDPVPVVGPPLPQSAVRVVYDVHAIGNPFLWWFSTAAIALLTGFLVHRLWTGLRRSHRSAPLFNPATWTVLYLSVNWIISWLPWARVSRCTFLYHYMGASVFSLLAIALLVDRWLQSDRPWQRITGITVILLIGLSFLFWLPLYLGLPLSNVAFRARLWFPSWI